MSRPRSKTLQHLDEQTAPQADVERSQLDTIIIECVGRGPGWPLSQHAYAILDLLREVGVESVNESERNDLLGAVERRMEYLATIGDITKMVASSASPGYSETLYYPKDFRFVVIPRNMLQTNDPTPPILRTPLTPPQKKFSDSFINIIDSMSPRVRLEILAEYCDRCGERRLGHVCHE